MAKQNKVFKIFYNNPNWNLPELDYYGTRYNLKEAKELKRDLMMTGFKKVCIKQRKV